MADNVSVTQGAGTTFAADDISSVYYPRVKVTWGPDGTANDADVASGKPLPAQLRHSDGTIVTDATGMKISTSQLAALNTTAQTMSAGFQLTDVPTDGTNATRMGSLTETAPATDTASSGLNGRLQRIAQRITSLIALLPSALGSAGGLKVDDVFSQYETVAASQTDQAMGATGATGDYIAGLLIVPGTSAAGAVSIKDGSGSSISVFAGGGTTALADLKPFLVPLGLYSTGGAWKITTGANVTAIGIGKFT